MSIAAVAERSEQSAWIEVGKIQAIKVAAQAKVGLGAVVGKVCAGRNLDDGEGPHQIEIAVRHGMIWKARQRQCRADQFGDMRDARLLARAPAFDGHGGADFCECGRLHPDRLLKIQDGPAEQPGQVEMPLLQAVDAGIMRVVPGVIVNVDAPEGLRVANDLCDLAQHVCR
jgi:hypothetical protein